MATALLETTFENTTLEGVRALHLEVAEDEASATVLYNKLGFRVVCRRVGYYRRPNKLELASILMPRDLKDL